MIKKICSECKVGKEITFFYSNKAKQNGVYSRCIECEKLHIKTYKSTEIIIDSDLLKKETWQNLIINNIISKYYISNCGRIKTQYKKIAKPSFDQRGYPQIVLSINGKRISRRIHRLVAENFIYNEYNKREVNHRDGNKLNNSIWNLEWVTSKENTKHAYENNLR